MARIMRSAKDLWSLISGSSILNCKDLVKYELEENSDRILEGILFFKKSSPSAVDAFKKTIEEDQFEFVNKLSKLIDVDIRHCYELFISYATYEFKGTQKTLESHLSIERHVQSLLLEVWQYYYSERLYYLLILKHILGHWQDSTDQYKDIYDDFLDRHNKDNALIKKVICQLESSIKAEPPSKDSHGVYMTDLLVYNWVTFMLKEQTELLQLILLYYKVVEPSIEDVQKMFSIFKSHGFGLRQSFRGMMSNDAQNLVHPIGHLESFIIIQCFELDFLYKCKRNGMISEHYLLKNEKALKTLNGLVLGLGGHQSHSPILLAWLIVAKCSEVPDILIHASKLGKTALQLDVFNFLASALTSPMISSPGIVTDIANNAVHSLLAGVFCEFDLQHLGPLKPLLSIMESILQFPSIAEDFWSMGEEAGIADLFNYCIEIFPVDFCPLLNVCASLCLASEKSCLKVIEQLKNLPSFTECWENVDERDVVATHEPNVWQLLTDRSVYGDSNLIIPKGTLGLVSKYKETSFIIQWSGKMNGWQICLREVYLKLQEMSFSTAFLHEKNMQRLVSVAKLVNNILKTSIDTRFLLSHIINVLFSILQRVISSHSPSLEYISVCIRIAATLSKHDLSDVWHQLTQIQFLPYMTNTPKDVTEMIRGICMNTGILGQLIAAKEYVSGDYSMCLAFLDLVDSISLTMKKEDNNFLACIIFILRELFSNFHKWHYNDSQQRILIGQKCLNLLHNLLWVQEKISDKLSNVQELCVFGLLHYEAGQTLLKIVCTGEEVIQQTILKQNSMIGDQIALMIRLALSVLNRLLLLRNNSSVVLRNESSPLEAVLFSTPGHVNQPQVVLMIAHYAFQHYYPRLATLAVQLLKRFAKEFPMSLLACFGSEADAIRDHFLARLNSPYEDIRLKVSILEFLTVCVVQQPGLIEMFINVKRKGDKSSEEEKTKSCLQCIKKILKEKKNESNQLYPRELLCASVEFIHALWAGHQALAMEALKEDAMFWDLMCDSVMGDAFSLENPAMNAYIIRTIALEAFYNNRNKLSEKLQTKFDEMKSKSLLLKWSKIIHGSSGDGNQSRFQCSLFDSSDFQDSYALLTAWRDFLLIIASYEPIQTTSCDRQQMLKDVLAHLLKELKENNTRVLILLSELFLMLSRHWQKDLVELLNSEDSNTPMYNILCEVAYNADSIHPRLQLVAVSIAVNTIRTITKSNSKISNVKEWITPCCQLLKKCSILIHQPFESSVAENILKLPNIIVLLLNELIQEVKDWLSLLKNHSIVPLLVGLLIKSLKLNIGLELSHSIITLFLSMASDKKAAETLISTGFMSEITLVLANVDLKALMMEKRTHSIAQKAKLNKIDVYFVFVRFGTALLQTLGNYFLQDCWNFFGVHQDIMHLSLTEMKNSFTRESIDEAILTATFILQLSNHQHVWRIEHPKSLQVLLVDVCNCIYGTVAILNKPELLKYLVMNRKHPESRLKSLKSLETESLLKRTSLDDRSSSSTEVQEIQNRLFQLLAVMLSILTKYSSEMHETMSGNILDYSQWQPLLHINFSIPSLDRDGPLCFGTILACVHMCLIQLAKNDKISPQKSTESSLLPIDRHLLVYILEISLSILLSQSTSVLMHPELSSRDKQMVRRELAAELNSMNISVNRYLRKTPPSPGLVNSISPGISKTNDFPFIKLISNLVDKLFK